MNSNKILLGGLAGGIAFFLLGWLVYGILLMDFMRTSYNQCSMNPEGEMIWWALILSNFAYSFLFAFIFSWTKTTGWMGGAKVAGIIGLLMASYFDLSMYSMSTMFNGLSVVFLDIIIAAVFAAVIGAIIGLVMGMGKKEA
jgi:hypothetical protein